jgi:hypothetical protein
LSSSKWYSCNWHEYDNLAGRADALLALIDSVKAKKVLIDMRQNGGGDFTLGLRYGLTRATLIGTPMRMEISGPPDASGSVFAVALSPT